ncbi:hypothetical protein SAMN04487916_110144 [Arthrobacter sp. ov407]|uniref:hypothetical protein n=1 Tax=Arthrobacter sp. ov407 TaxID=1761748 RepID=UPI00087F05B8|nr:hypothetical protein [Arthrobacter sp. ov407]SDL55867.1 hypothetical protein SAMN04487916_110144 [Arthrobacter sp. ov407]
MAEVTPAGSGGAPVVSAPPADGSLRIRGGIGGVSFQFEELLAGAAALDGLVRQLQSVEVEADAVKHALFPYQPDSYTSGSNAIVTVGEAGRDVGRVRSQLQHIGDDVRASHREYEYAEARNALLLRMGFHGSEYGAAPEPFALPGVRGIVEDWVAMAPRNLAVLLGLPGPLAAVAGGLSGPTDIRRLVRDATDAPGLMFLKPRPVSIVGREKFTADVDLSPAGLLRRAGAVGEQGGRIEVIEVDGGSRPAWVVIIPGTQQGGLPEGANPFDPAGIAEALGYDSEWTAGAIRQALQQAGAEAGDQLVAVGYSQGGIHAMNLSKDRAFLAEYDLKFVLTAGSPVGGISPGPGIRSLHLEHEQDWVPGADGLANPDTRDRVTVTLTNPLAVPPLQDFGLGPGHRLENYADGAALVSASWDNTLKDSTTALAAVVGTGGAATVTRFSLRREARPAAPGTPATPAPRGMPGATAPRHGPGASSGRGREGSSPRGTPG